MAKAPAKTENSVAKTTAAASGVAVPPETMNFSQDAGAGMEGATQESFAIPFLSVLQKGSPQVDEASGVALEGARQGMFFENVTGKMYDGKAGIVVVPAAYRRVFLRWAVAGFKGEIMPEEVATLRAAGKIVELDGRLYFPLPDGTVNPKLCDRVADVRNHYVLLLDEATGIWSQALLSLGSTQIKKSKMLMSALASVKLKGAGGFYTPATWANRVRITTIPESNDKGSWMGVRFEIIGQVTRNDQYNAGRAFHDSVRKGTVEAKYEEEVVREDPTTYEAKDGAF